TRVTRWRRVRARPRAMAAEASASGARTPDAIAASASRTSSRRIELDLRDLVVLEVDVQARVRRVQGRLHGADRAAHRVGDVVEREIGVLPEHERDALPGRERVDRG